MSLVGNRYKVLNQLSNQGGMGYVVFALDHQTGKEVVIKFCKNDNHPELIKRFKREVRLLQKYSNSGYVIPVTDIQLDIMPYYFVMPKASNDLTVYHHIPLEQKENMFYRMIHCVDYIHQYGDRHRDIKPENFLLLDNIIYISDLGLAKDPSSLTQFTQSIDVRGTPVYSPPNFFEQNGGFKSPTVEDDIFSLGKTFYFLLSGQVPFYILPGSINPALFEIIKKCTKDDREKRYKTCSELKAELKSAFDLIFARVDLNSEYYRIKRELANSSSKIWGDSNSLRYFISQLKDKDPEEQIDIFKNYAGGLFTIFCQHFNLTDHVIDLITIYESIREFVSQRYWPFSYAETVADNISYMFNSPNVDNETKTEGLRVALNFAIDMHRGAAGETCARMIESIREDGLAFSVGRLLNEYGNEFVFDHCVKPSDCKNDHILQAIISKKSQTTT